MIVFNTYNYIIKIKRVFVKHLEKQTLKNHWLFTTMFLCTLISLFFAFPSYEAIDPSVGRLKLFLMQCNSITEFWQNYNYTNLSYRITVPLFLNIIGGGLISSIIMRHIVGVILFGLCSLIIFKFTKDRVSALLFSLALALTVPGFTSFCEYRGNFDGIALFLIILAFHFRNPFIVISCLIFGFFTDERTLFSIGFLIVYGIMISQYNFNNKKRYVNLYNFSILVGLFSYILLRLWIYLEYHINIQEILQMSNGWILLGQINNIPLALWTGLEGFWLIIFISVYILIKNKDFIPASIYIFTIVVLAIAGNSVTDSTRSIMYIFPATIIGVKIISDNTDKNEVRNILLLTLFFSFIWPSYGVGGKSSIWWQYPLPLQMLRWYF